MSLIRIFERIYIVNLPERSDRRLEMDHELARIGLRVDGSALRYFPAIRPDDAGLFPSIGARGCFLSHLAILDECVRERINRVLVLEDDASLSENLAQLGGDTRQSLEGSWDMAYLGHRLDLPRTARQWIQFPGPVATTHAYALRGAAIQTLQQHLRACLAREPGHPEGSPMHVDGAFSVYRQQHPAFITLVSNPSLVGQRSSRSDIYPNRWYDRMAATRGVLGIARRMKNARKAAA